MLTQKNKLTLLLGLSLICLQISGSQTFTLGSMTAPNGSQLDLGPVQVQTTDVIDTLSKFTTSYCNRVCEPSHKVSMAQQEIAKLKPNLDKIKATGVDDRRAQIELMKRTLGLWFDPSSGDAFRAATVDAGFKWHSFSLRPGEVIS